MDFNQAEQLRILGIFPHPDDETLAAGILFQRVAQSAAAVRALFLTSGEGNTWPLRVWERRWRITSSHRFRFALRREGEALAALSLLGLPSSSAIFLHWPDTQLTSLLLDNPVEPVARLTELIDAFRPTHVLAPLLGDSHPDHSVAAAMVFAALQLSQIQILGYIAHFRPHQTAVPLLELQGSAEAVAKKRQAIAAHSSQMVFRRRFHMSFAQTWERFYSMDAAAAQQPVTATLCDRQLRVKFQLPLSYRSFRRPHLLLLWQGSKLASCSVPLPLLLSAGEARDSSGERLRLSVRRFSGWGQVTVTFPEMPSWALVKLYRPFLLFDETGFVVAKAPKQD